MLPCNVVVQEPQKGASKSRRFRSLQPVIKRAVKVVMGQ